MLKKKKNNQNKSQEAEKTPTKKGRLFKGTIVSDKMDKTVVVLVSRYKEHPKYKKRYKIGKKYKVHDQKNEYKVGDKVIIQENKPISKGKRWRVIKKI